MNKKGQILPIILVIGGLIALILLMIFGMLAWGVVKSTTDILIPEFNTIGEVSPGNNISEYTVLALTPVDTVISNFGLLMGLMYIVGIIGILTFAFIFRSNRGGWVVALFVVGVLVLIFVSIFVSNSYEDFYLSQDELGTELRSATLASFFIIHSPSILTFIAFIGAIILFTGREESSLNF